MAKNSKKSRESKESKKRVEKSKKVKVCELYVDGMHCAACELLVEKKILKKFNDIESVDASLADGVVRLNYIGETPDIQKLNATFKEDKYHFSSDPEDVIHEVKSFEFDSNGNLKIDTASLKRNIAVIAMALGFLLLFFGFEDLLRESGMQYAGIDTLTSPDVVWGFSAFLIVLITGMIAGFSSCASLVGGLLLSMSKQWNDLNNKSNVKTLRSVPYVMFNVGRLIAFPLFGAALGLLGSRFSLSIEANSLLVVGVSVLMFALAGQMLGWKRFRGFVLRVPRFVTDRIADESKFNGKIFPFFIGFFTFLLPCGFTTLAMAAAVLSGDPLTGALVMFMFALGTLPGLIAVSALSIYSSKSVRFNSYFTKVAGYIVLYFAVAALNAQFKILGTPNLSSINDIYSFIEFGVFLVMFGTFVSLIVRNIKAVGFVNGSAAKLYRLVLAFVYLLFFISMMVAYNFLMPWEYDFSRIIG